MIDIRHLEKKYGDSVRLKDINIRISKGEVVSIIGPSGTGKSTLLRCINMLTVPTGGQILIDGVDITDKKTDLRRIRHKLGMVFQSYNLFAHKMVIENVSMGPMDLLGVSKQEAFDEGVKYLQMVGLGQKLYSYPDELSGGQKQRVAIARCLAMKPKIILFDEPTSALDPKMTGEVQAVIHDLAKQGLTMMVVTHDMQFSRKIADRVLYLDEGIVYEEGTPDQIFDSPVRKRTRAFVKRLKTLEYSIDSKDFDLYDLNACIAEFARNNFMQPRQMKNIQLVLEELILHQLLSHTQDIHIALRYYEVDRIAELDLSYGGEKYDPYESEDEDVLSMLVVRQMTTDVAYRFEERNQLSLKVALAPAVIK